MNRTQNKGSKRIFFRSENKTRAQTRTEHKNNSFKSIFVRTKHRKRALKAFPQHYILKV